ncbi:S8 family peptidase [Saccharibacillus brassicae]|uniref:S8 family serine peptidase n=1 Tax=Saccharibacillus brassicae TaxID=2583377 RepID=A0A4Y6UV24_SACBS|nr:S8 family serine peptidase [Saccharibacillus brassicae]QDH20418.1 S8 family serine peptidase [Saccharibacillus brassicae]
MNKKHLSVALSSLLVLPLLAQAGPANFATAEGADQEVVIVYKNEEGKEAALQQTTEVRHEFETVPAVSAAVSPTELRDLVNNPDIAYVERNISFGITDADVEGYSSTPKPNTAEKSRWNFQEVAPDTMWNQGFTGQGVKVAVIDSGISAHPELKIAGGVSTVGPDMTSNFADDNGHGTHVAGIIAADTGSAQVTGVAPNVSLYGIKSLGANGKGSLQDVLEGLDWAIQNKMDIINLSLGSEDDSQALHDMVDKAYEQGIIVVASAGNSGTVNNVNTDTVNYPAKYASVISVAAVDENRQHAVFSSAGPKVDFSAPGVSIVSTYPSNLPNSNGNPSYAGMDGTSQAAPHIAGELALLKEKNPSASASTLRTLLKSYAVDLGTPGRDNLYGEGFVTFKSKQDLAAPGEVNGAAVTQAKVDSLTLGWNAPADSDFKEVRVYGGTDTSFTTVTQNVYTASNLTADTDYQFRLTTVDTAGNESAGVKVNGRTLAASNNAGSPVVTPPVVTPTPTQTAPDVVNLPVVPTPAPSGGSAQIPSGGGGGGGGGFGGGGGGGAAPAPAAPAPAAPAPAAPAVVVPAKPAVTPTTPVAVTPAPTVPAPTVSEPVPTTVVLPFPDIKPTFWGRETIIWGFERGLVKGYADGQFKPGSTVTESEFLAMLIRAFEPQVKNAVSGTWSNTYYVRAKQLNLPLKGYASKTARAQKLTRVQVAELLSSANGVERTGSDAIRYVLSSGIASGSSKTQKTVASFKGSGTLTRAEALQFIKNLTEKGGGSLK